jgi:hypothetical protein
LIPIDDPTPEALFADALMPLQQVRSRQGLRYFERSADPALPSYWQPVASRTGGMVRCELGEAQGTALLDALGAYWEATGEDRLGALLPELEAMRRTLHEAAPPSSERTATVSYSAYPLF